MVMHLSRGHFFHEIKAVGAHASVSNQPCSVVQIIVMLIISIFLTERLEFGWSHWQNTEMSFPEVLYIFFFNYFPNLLHLFALTNSQIFGIYLSSTNFLHDFQIFTNGGIIVFFVLSSEVMSEVK